MTAVMIGVDPAKRSHAMAVLDGQEELLASLQVVNDTAGYRDMLRLAKRWPQRTWAVEGAGGVGVQLAQRLVADGETVIDVPPKLSTRARIFDVGHGRKNDPADARTVAVVALRTRNLRAVVVDDVTSNVQRVSSSGYKFSGSINPTHPGATVSLFRNGVVVRSGIPVNSSRAYSYTADLAPGTYNFQVRTGKTGYNNASASPVRSVSVPRTTTTTSSTATSAPARPADADCGGFSTWSAAQDVATTGWCPWWADCAAGDCTRAAAELGGGGAGSSVGDGASLGSGTGVSIGLALADGDWSEPAANTDCCWGSAAHPIVKPPSTAARTSRSPCALRAFRSGC